MIEVVRRAIEIHDKLHEVKALYKEQDEILQKMIEAGFTSVVVDGKLVALVDNFAEKNTVFKATGFRRFELLVQESI